MWKLIRYESDMCHFDCDLSGQIGYSMSIKNVIENVTVLHFNKENTCKGLSALSAESIVKTVTVQWRIVFKRQLMIISKGSARTDSGTWPRYHVGLYVGSWLAI